VALKYPISYGCWLVILWVLSKIILGSRPCLRENFFWVHLLRKRLVTTQIFVSKQALVT
jgi:hypothetical protein